MLKINNSDAYQQACKFLPGGVNSPVRAFRGMNTPPVFIKSAKGSKLYSIENKEYIDFCLSWGVSIAGHARRKIIKRTMEAINRGTSYGCATLGETELAKNILAAFGTENKIRFANSGTEAVMSAIRLARAITQRDIIVKFDGGYHGHSDSLLVGAGSGVAYLSFASSQGIPQKTIETTMSLPFNNEEALKEVFHKNGQHIAAIILEPIPANMGLVPPKPGFLEFLRKITRLHGSLLIYDEVITGFRKRVGSIVESNEIEADLYTVGKIIGAGFPIGAYLGKAEYMDLIAPSGPVYQAGTLSGNPVAVAAGLAMLEIISESNFYGKLHKKCEQFYSLLQNIIENYPVSMESNGSMFTIFFRKEKPINFNEAKETDTKRFSQFYCNLLDKGVYLSPAQLETNFISIKHSMRDLENTAQIIEDSLKKVF